MQNFTARAAEASVRDAVIIGGGHNGLVCAAYLAAAGLKVTVLERRAVVGGAAVTEEFHPGFRNSVAAYTVSLLNPKIIRDLELPRHGLRVVERQIGEFPASERHRISESRRGKNRAGSGEVFGARCRAPLRLWYPARSDRRCAARSRARNSAERQRRELAGGVARTAAGRALGQANREARHDAAARIAGSVRQVGGRLSRLAGSRALRSRRRTASTASSATTRVPTRRAPPTCCCTTCSARSTARRARGATRSAAWARSRRRWPRPRPSAASTFALRVPVREVIVEAGRAVGVVTESGEAVRARCVVSNVNPKLLYESLIDASALTRGLSRAHTPLALRLGNVPHERRALGVARLHGIAGPQPEPSTTPPASSWRRVSPTWIRPIWMPKPADGRSIPSSRC